jgi:hypothetical protein
MCLGIAPAKYRGTRAVATWTEFDLLPGEPAYAITMLRQLLRLIGRSRAPARPRITPRPGGPAVSLPPQLRSPHPGATSSRFDPNTSADHAPGGASLSYSYYRED